MVDRRDAAGTPIDPTKNVLDLVRAAIQRQDDLRDAESRYQTAMREAETRRIDDLATMRDHYSTIIKEMEANSLKLLAEQLKENKSDSSTRTSLLEQFRWESGGKFSGANTLWVLLIGVLGAVGVGFALLSRGQ